MVLILKCLPFGAIFFSEDVFWQFWLSKMSKNCFWQAGENHVFYRLLPAGVKKFPTLYIRKDFNYLCHYNITIFNSLLPGRYDSKFKSIIFKVIIQNCTLGTCRQIVLRWIPQKLINEQTTLVQVMAWCHQATQAITWAYVDPDLCHHIASQDHNELTLSMWGLSYLGLTRSILWLLMPWLLTSPGHQQPW